MGYRPMKIDDQSDLLMDFGFKPHFLNRLNDSMIYHDC